MGGLAEGLLVDAGYWLYDYQEAQASLSNAPPAEVAVSKLEKWHPPELGLTQAQCGCVYVYSGGDGWLWCCGTL